LPFTKKGKRLESLNLYQLYFQRYGIGKTISKKISLNVGVSPIVKMELFKENDINNQIKFIFIKGEEFLDISLEKKMLISLQNSIDIYDYRGCLYKAKLPLNGQRRRANARTAKRIRPIIIS
jgi:ribosomal protein S13